MSNPSKPSGKLLHIEFLRVLAICFVMFNHTGHSGFVYFLRPESTLLQWIYILPSILCTCAVPLYFMMSGALLLGKSEPLSVVFRKRVGKFVVILLAISLFYYFYKSFVNGAWGDIPQFLKRVYTDDMMGQLWYLYSFIGVLLMLPLLRKLAQSMENIHYIYLALMALFFTGILPMVEYRLFQGSVQLNGDVKVPLFTTASIVFFLMGYYFEHVMPRSYLNQKTFWLSAAIALLSLLVTGYMTFYHGRVIGGLDENSAVKFYSSFIALPAYALYVMAKIFFESVTVPKKTAKAITFLGSTTFGIYLLEPVLSLETWFIADALKPYITAIPAACVRILCTLLAGSLLIGILKKIPGIKKLL